MSQTFWIFVVVTGGAVVTISVVYMMKMGTRAYTSGAAPGSAEGFTSFASQVLRITTVIAVIGATVALAIHFDGKIDAAISGILSGIAGYVLGGSEKTPRLGKRKNDIDKTDKSKLPG